MSEIEGLETGPPSTITASIHETVPSTTQHFPGFGSPLQMPDDTSRIQHDSRQRQNVCTTGLGSPMLPSSLPFAQMAIRNAAAPPLSNNPPPASGSMPAAGSSRKAELSLSMKQARAVVPHEDEAFDIFIKCRQCDRALTKMKSLYRHLRTVHEDAQYVCSVCGRCFARKDILDRHAARQHENVPTGAVVSRENGAALTYSRRTKSVRSMAISGQPLADEKFGSPGAGQDPLLIALYMWNFLNPGNVSRSFVKREGYQTINLEFVERKHRLRWLSLKASASRLLRNQVSDEALVLRSNSLWLTSLMFALMSRFFTDTATIEADHLSEGAVTIMAARHRLLCPCGGITSCSTWRPFLASDPWMRSAIALVQRNYIGSLAFEGCELPDAIHPDYRVMENSPGLQYPNQFTRTVVFGVWKALMSCPV